MPRRLSIVEWRKRTQPPFHSYFTGRRNPIAERGTVASSIQEGLGIDFKYHEELNRWPAVLYWLRCSVTAVDAILRWADSGRRGRPLTVLRKQLALKLGRALGRDPFDYDAAFRVLKNWRLRSIRIGRKAEESGREATEKERVWYQLMNETLTDLPVILERHRDPKNFFSVIAPRVFRYDFQYSDWETLGHALWTFGPGALCHPGLRSAFDSLSPDELELALASAEGHTAYRVGRRLPATRQVPTSSRRGPGRPRGSYKLEPKKNGKPGTIEKHLYRRKQRK